MNPYAYDHFYLLLPTKLNYLTIHNTSWEIKIKQICSWEVIESVESNITDLCKGFPAIISEHIY